MLNSWISQALVSRATKKTQAPIGYAYFLGFEEKKAYKDIVEEQAADWQLDSLLKSSEKEVTYFSGKNGPVWILRPKEPRSSGHWGVINESTYTWARDTVGSLLGFFKAHQLKSVVFECLGTEKDQELGALVGMDLASYSFRETYENKKSSWPTLHLLKDGNSFDKDLIKEASIRAGASNLARHWVNLPPNDLHPHGFTAELKKLKWGTSTKIEFWNAARLKKENCNLILAVGAGSVNSPCLVHIRHRPKGATGQPIAFVGKGITFDTGGLDIKPSSGMRLMKKDMGGAAAVASLAWYVSQANIPVACDFYLALAENSVGGSSFRPSDIVVSRSGLRVEIDNTDAEGRLVLADALDVAVSQKGKNEPEVVINVATLTGAIKVALGADVAGLFSNDDALSDRLLDAAQKSGEYFWRMPLVDKYFSGLSSPFADFKNSSDGFGGAITAALFLQKFVRGKKWAHLDIYAWTDKASGALTSSGGSGQPVQSLVEFLHSL